MSYAIQQPFSLSVNEDCELRMLDFSSIDFCHKTVDGKNGIMPRLQSKRLVKGIRQVIADKRTGLSAMDGMNPDKKGWEDQLRDEFGFSEEAIEAVLQPAKKANGGKIKGEIGNVEDYFDLLAPVTDAEKYQFRAIVDSLSAIKTSLGTVFEQIIKSKSLS